MSEKRKTNGHSRPEDFLLPRFEEVELPSGMKAKLRPPSLDMWILYGELPSRLLAESNAGAVDEAVQAMSPQDILAWDQHTVCYVFLEPRFSIDDQPGTFHPSQLRSEDRQFVIEWCKKFLKAGGGAGLGRFRGEKGEPGGAGPRGEEVRQGSE